MTSDEIRGALRARPFRPFAIHTDDGETYPVSASEMAWHPPGFDLVTVVGTGGYAWLGIEQITGITFTLDTPGVQGRVERLRRLKRADPFVPFVLHLADGRRFPVATAEYIAISPGGRTVGIFGEGDSFKLLDAGQITDVEPGPGAPPATRP